MEDQLNNTDAILQELNESEVKRHIPLITFLLILCLGGSLGNALVLYIYKTKYSSSNCRTFVLFLSVVDMFSASLVIPTEIAVLFREYIFQSSGLCKLSIFLNTWPTLTSGFLLLAIAIDRYRKVCEPFNWQISHRVAKIMCFLTALTGVAFSWISPIIYGAQNRFYERYQVNVSECVETDAWKETVFPLINNASFALLFLGALCGIIVMYCHIAIHVRRHINKKSTLGTKSGKFTIEQQEASDLTVMSGKVFLKTNVNDNRFTPVTESSDDMFCSNSVSEAQPTMPHQDTVNPIASSMVICSLDDHIELADKPDRKSIISRMLSFGRSTLTLTKTSSVSSNKKEINPKMRNSKQGNRQKHRTAFIMFLISLAFIISYLPLLCILLIRTADSTFVPSLSDSGRAAYKFFLRSYYLNCAVNPIIYGIWDSRFRKHTRQLLCRC